MSITSLHVAQKENKTIEERFYEMFPDAQEDRHHWAEEEEDLLDQPHQGNNGAANFEPGEIIQAICVRGRCTILERYILSIKSAAWSVRSVRTQLDFEADVLVDALIFRDEPLPFKIDTDKEFSSSNSNSMINIVTKNPADTLAWIKKNNLNHRFDQWDTLRFCTDDRPNLNSEFRPI